MISRIIILYSFWLEQVIFTCNIINDLSKAFDTVDHNILLAKLKSCGIRGEANSLLKSYLLNSEQHTCILGESSTFKKVIYGVPQGSVLGTLLFLLYINDIMNCLNDINKVKLVFYADNTNIFVIGDDHKSTVIKANGVL